MSKERTKNFVSLGILIAIVAIFIYSLIIGKSDLEKQNIANIHIDSLDKKEKAKRYPLAKEIVNPAGYINTESVSVAEFIGKKVILLDFWTFSCINCQRTLPYLTSWHEKYKDKGLVIIGVHTPEFSFEKERENVLAAVEKYSIKYPVVMDNDYATWKAYQNRYWPRKYLIDIDGFIVYDHIGEGAYETTEMKIQELLTERMRVLGQEENIEKDISKPELAEDLDLDVDRSPEIYFGSERNSLLGNGRSGVTGNQKLDEPKRVKTDTLYLIGDWGFEPEFAQNKSAGAKIIFKFQAQKVFIVASANNSVKAKILLDGEEVDDIAGEDVEEGQVAIKESKLYRLIEADLHGEHTLEIIIEEPGVKFFTFTFG